MIGESLLWRCGVKFWKLGKKISLKPLVEVVLLVVVVVVVAPSTSSSG